MFGTSVLVATVLWWPVDPSATKEAVFLACIFIFLLHTGEHDELLKAKQAARPIYEFCLAQVHSLGL